MSMHAGSGTRNSDGKGRWMSACVPSDRDPPGLLPPAEPIQSQSAGRTSACCSLSSLCKREVSAVLRLRPDDSCPLATGVGHASCNAASTESPAPVPDTTGNCYWRFGARFSCAAESPAWSSEQGQQQRRPKRPSASGKDFMGSNRHACRCWPQGSRPPMHLAALEYCFARVERERLMMG